jgi:NADPH:quinone reductase-like Zn-dependent oxidoreductase
MMRAGTYPRMPRPPFVPGWDVAGEVDAVGTKSDRHWIGHRAIALVLRGGYASHVIVPVASLVRVPDGVDLNVAACLPVNYLTAQQLLNRAADVQPGDRVLIRGATGAVGGALLELGTATGAAFAGTGSATRRGLIEDAGTEYVDESGPLTVAGAPPDVILDGVGGSGLVRSLNALNKSGHLISFGLTAAVDDSSPRLATLRQGVRVFTWSQLSRRRVSAYRLSATARRHPGLIRSDLERLVEELSAGRIAPQVAEVLPLERAADAHRLLERRGLKGKVLLAPAA